MDIMSGTPIIKRGTTPTHTIGVPPEVGSVQKVRIVYAQDGKAVFKKENDQCAIEEGAVSVKLTQEDTLSLTCSKTCEIELHVLTPGNDSIISEPIVVVVAKCLDNEVLV